MLNATKFDCVTIKEEAIAEASEAKSVHLLVA